jgi:hypothetical protein
VETTGEIVLAWGPAGPVVTAPARAAVPAMELFEMRRVPGDPRAVELPGGVRYLIGAAHRRWRGAVYRRAVATSPTIGGGALGGLPRCSTPEVWAADTYCCGLEYPGGTEAVPARAAPVLGLRHTAVGKGWQKAGRRRPGCRACEPGRRAFGSSAREARSLCAGLSTDSLHLQCGELLTTGRMAVLATATRSARDRPPLRRGRSRRTMTAESRSPQSITSSLLPAPS